jgi:hypothetical protein
MKKIYVNRVQPHQESRSLSHSIRLLHSQVRVPALLTNRPQVGKTVQSSRDVSFGVTRRDLKVGNHH